MRWFLRRRGPCSAAGPAAGDRVPSGRRALSSWNQIFERLSPGGLVLRDRRYGASESIIFFERLDGIRRLSVMARSGRQLAIPHRPQLAAQRLHRNRDAKRPATPNCADRRGASAPTPSASGSGPASTRSASARRCASVSLGCGSGSLAIDQSVRPLLVETQHQSPHDLWRHTGESSAARPRGTPLVDAPPARPAGAPAPHSPDRPPQAGGASPHRSRSAEGFGAPMANTSLFAMGNHTQPLTMSHRL